MLGSNVDVVSAYKYMNKPGNELFQTGAFNPAVVSGYLMEQGCYPTSASFDMEPNSVYISYFAWKSGDKKGWHFMCLSTDANGAITGYNYYNKIPYASYGDFALAHNIAPFGSVGLAIYR